jgi:hypothetical protein
MDKYPNLPDSESDSEKEIESEIKIQSEEIYDNNIESKIFIDSIDYEPEITYLGTIISKINFKQTLYKQKFSKIYNMVDIMKSGVEFKGINSSHINKMFFYYKNNPNAHIEPLNIIQLYDKFYVGSDIHKFEALSRLLPLKKDNDILYYLHIVNSLEELENLTTILNDNNKVVCVFPHQKINHFVNRIRASYPGLFSLQNNKLKMNEMLLRDKLNEIKLFEKIKLNEIEIFNQLINFNRKIDNEFRSRISRSRKETEFYTRIFESHRFFCLLYEDFSWVHHFFNYLENVIKNNIFLI